MAAFVLTNVQVLLDEDNWTAQTVGVTVDATVRMERTTNMASGGFEESIPGLLGGTLGFSGYADYTSATTSIGSKLTNADIGSTKVASLYPNGGATAGDPAIIMSAPLSALQMPTGAVGEVAKFNVALTSSGGFAIGGLVGAPLASRTTAGLTGTAVALTGPTATQRLYAALHVTAASGTNLAVKVQSDNAVGFPSATDRITFSTVSAVGSQYSSVAGDLSTETHFRVLATIASGTFSFAVAFGVG